MNCQAKGKTKAKANLLALLNFISNSYSRPTAGRQEKSTQTNVKTLLISVSQRNISNAELGINSDDKSKFLNRNFSILN